MSLLAKPTVGSEAWVLRAWSCGETSVIASLLTREHGYVRMMAKGARGPRSQLRPLVEPGRLVNVEFSWNPDRELQYLRSGTVLLDFLTGDPTLEGTAYLLGALELADRCRPIQGSGSDRTAVEVFAICEEFLRVLSSEACSDPAFLFFAFEWELLQRHGVAPEVDSCSCCGEISREGADSALWFSPADGGLVCGGCVRRGDAAGGKPLGLDALALLRLMSEDGLRIPVDLPLPRAMRRQLGAHLHRFLGYHMPGYRLPSALELLRAGKDSSR
ncbi:MAG: DNA repair protein RecO [Hyphomicrobiaceae bacterium]|nr:DNA repair protein RecO [Hyphomicrobiaceae bacterium]